MAGHERAECDREEDRGGRHDRAAALHAGGDCVRVGLAVVVCLLDPGEQHHAVVGREAEHDRDEDEEVGLLDSLRFGEAEQAREVAVLEDEYEHAGGGCGGQQVHHQCLDRQHHRAGHQPQHGEREDDEQRDRDRQRSGGRGVLVDQGSCRAADRHGIGCRAGPYRVHDALGLFGDRCATPVDIDLPGVAGEVARGGDVVDARDLLQPGGIGAQRRAGAARGAHREYHRSGIRAGEVARDHA